MKALIKSAEVFTRSFPARDGKAAVTFREQRAAVDRDGDFPLPFTIGLEENQQPYPPGEYNIESTSLQSNKFGGLEFGRRIIITPIKKA